MFHREFIRFSETKFTIIAEAYNFTIHFGYNYRKTFLNFFFKNSFLCI